MDREREIRKVSGGVFHSGILALWKLKPRRLDISKDLNKTMGMPEWKDKHTGKNKKTKPECILPWVYKKLFSLNFGDREVSKNGKKKSYRRKNYWMAKGSCQESKIHYLGTSYDGLFTMLDVYHVMNQLKLSSSICIMFVCVPITSQIRV